MRIGLLTSGGDAPGMNAAVVGAIEEARDRKYELILIADGYAGLLDGRTATVERSDEGGLIGIAGTVLRTSRCPRMRTDDGIRDAVAAIEQLELECLIVVGGGGSLAAAARMAAAGGTPVVGVPATIDLDVPYLTTTLGADSALNYAVRALDDLRATAASLPGRAFVVETLGGDTGYLATTVGRLAGASVVLTPEESWDPAYVALRMKQDIDHGYTIVVMSEGVGSAVDICRQLEPHFGDRIRPTTLGHSMRGASPSALDRLLGLSAGRCAVETAAVSSESVALVLGATHVTGITGLMDCL